MATWDCFVVTAWVNMQWKSTDRQTDKASEREREGERDRQSQ